MTKHNDNAQKEGEMTKVIVNVMGKRVKEYESKEAITLESILKGVGNFKREMDKLGIPCKVSKPKLS